MQTRFNPSELRLPIIASPMFIASGKDLVMAQCTSGIVGTFPALNARPQSALRPMIEDLKQSLDQYRAAHPGRYVAPFGVNQVMSPHNDRFREDWEDIIACEVPIIITSLKPPQREEIERIHAYGGVIYHDATTTRHAQKAIEAGVDGVILVCAGAGGHAGSINPFALYNEVRAIYDGTIILAGAIGNGSSIFAARALGADLVYMGTRFLPTIESNIDQDHKQFVIESGASDIVYTDLFTGIPANYLTKSLEKAGLDPRNLPRKEDGDFRKYKSGGDGDIKVWRDIKGGGQGIAHITRIERTADVIDTLEQEYRAALLKCTREVIPLGQTV